jgi:hypothetical protein
MDWSAYAALLSRLGSEGGRSTSRIRVPHESDAYIPPTPPTVLQRISRLSERSKRDL